MHSSSTLVLSTGLYIFFFKDTATTEIYTLSLHDVLPIFGRRNPQFVDAADLVADEAAQLRGARAVVAIAIVRLRGSDAEEQHDRRSENSPHAKSFRRSEELTSALQSHSDIVFRLLLEKKK